ncbi:hypothetical protein IMSAG049_01405 [Clostridiales bacterium]|nr:hypothetical protein IMSAG049_01405 [Clostridiales bacterium]
MERIKLSKTGIKDLQNFNWTDYFKYNNSHLIKLDFSNDCLSKSECKLIAPSIRAFQIGEGSDGAHLLKCAKKFAEKNNYSVYPEIMKWFVLEENRHSKTLKKYMSINHIKPCSGLWLDNIFRAMRKLSSLECEIIVLVTAEIIALSYYSALSTATSSRLLKTICAQMLHDELSHVVLQSDTLYKISRTRCCKINSLQRLIRRLIMSATAYVVWVEYRNLFVKGNFTYKKFKKHCNEYLKESICIEKTGELIKIKS